MLTRCVIFRVHADVPDVGGRLDVQQLAFFPLALIDPPALLLLLQAQRIVCSRLIYNDR